MISERISVEKDVMTWARHSARLDEETAAKKLGVSPTILQGWESGEHLPTINQLRKAANVYKRPLVVLLLPEPPGDFPSLPDHRTAEIVDPDGFSHELTVEIRRAHMQREILLELKEFVPEATPEAISLPDISQTDEPEQIGILLRNYLGFGENIPNSTGGGFELLRDWISAIEERGILVLHLRKVNPEEARGFSISEFPYPVIAINGSDLLSQRLFTLIHELAHVALSQGGVCDLHHLASIDCNRSHDKLEAHCNAITVATLMPAEKIHELHELKSLDEQNPLNAEMLQKLSQPFGVSAESFLLRLASLGLTSWDIYWEMRPQLLHHHKKMSASRKQEMRKSQGGPSYYRVKAHTLGHSYITTVLNAHAVNAITTVDAAHYLETRYDLIPKLAAAVS